MFTAIGDPFNTFESTHLHDLELDRLMYRNLPTNLHEKISFKDASRQTC